MAAARATQQVGLPQSTSPEHAKGDKLFAWRAHMYVYMCTYVCVGLRRCAFSGGGLLLAGLGVGPGCGAQGAQLHWPKLWKKPNLYNNQYNQHLKDLNTFLFLF